MKPIQNLLRKLLKKNFNILKVRSEKEIYFWIFFKQIIYFDFKFMTYCKNYIKFLSPKIVITFIDTNREFYELKNFLKKLILFLFKMDVELKKYYVL